MDNKYYIPELEEFYVGCRFAVKSSDGSSPYVTDMDYKTYLSWAKNNTLYKGIQEGKILMKYLDRQDIEELGWERDEDMDRGDYQAYFLELEDGAWSGFSLLKHTESNEVIIHQVHKKIEQYDTIRFYGDIKNYNELLKVQKMIGII